MGHLPTFTARVVSGAGRGKGLGVPTLNLHLDDVPLELREGIYAGWIELRAMSGEQPKAQNPKLKAAIHYGPRPVFKDSKTFEAHLIGAKLPSPPAAVTVTLTERIRDVRDFPSAEALTEEIARDIERCRAILGA